MSELIYLCINCKHPVDRKGHIENILVNKGNHKVRVKHYEICNCSDPKTDNSEYKCKYCEKIITGKEVYDRHLKQCKIRSGDPYYQNLMSKKWY